MIGTVVDLLGGAAIVAGLYVVLAYLMLPALWAHYEHQPGLRELPMRTATTDGIPGDPLNVSLVGTSSEVVAALRMAGWGPADAITFRTSVEIAGSVIFDRPDPYAPVSTLIYDGRRQDLAFENGAGRSVGQRHHVRLWQVLESGKEGRPVWLGAATFDKGVGLSRYTGQITHHIAADIDAERDRLIADLSRAGCLSHTYLVSGVGPTLRARNGGGDLFFTDGDILAGVISPGAAAHIGEPQTLDSPKLLAVKNIVWQRGKSFFSRIA